MLHLSTLMDCDSFFLYFVYFEIFSFSKILLSFFTWTDCCQRIVVEQDINFARPWPAQYADSTAADGCRFRLVEEMTKIAFLFNFLLQLNLKNRSQCSRSALHHDPAFQRRIWIYLASLYRLPARFCFRKFFLLWRNNDFVCLFKPYEKKEEKELQMLLEIEEGFRCRVSKQTTGVCHSRQRRRRTAHVTAFALVNRI